MPLLEAPARAARGRLACAIIVSLLAALAAVACNQSSGPALPPGRVTCEPLAKLISYRYRAEATLDLAARDPSQEPTDTYPPEPFKFTQAIEGAVLENGRISATELSTGISPAPTSTSVIAVDGKVWVNRGGDTWEPLDVGPGPPPVSYLPLDTCKAIAPDIDVSGETGEPETVGNVASQKYSFDSLSSDLPDRHPNLGPQSDAARLVTEFRGSIWIAEKDRYVTRLDLEGSGEYSNGRTLTLRISYELVDQNDRSIRIEPPD